jgi:Uma2 family endonuclease
MKGGAAMNVRLLPPPITVEEFDEMGERANGYELIDGRLREKGMGAESSDTECELIYLMKNWLRQYPLGRVYGSECMYRCFPRNPNRVRKPDVSFVRTERLPGGRSPRGILEVAPDFAAEVLSPNDKAVELSEKLADYHSAAIPLVWVLNPDLRTVQVRTTDGVIREFGAGEELTGDPVLPGFRVRVADLFPPPAESTPS